MAILKRAALCVLTLVAMWGPMPANADDVSKNAGICAALKFALKNEADADKALRTARNPQLAFTHGREWIRKMQQNTQDHDALFGDATRSCRKIGLSAS